MHGKVSLAAAWAALIGEHQSQTLAEKAFLCARVCVSFVRPLPAQGLVLSDAMSPWLWSLAIAVAAEHSITVWVGILPLHWSLVLLPVLLLSVPGVPTLLTNELPLSRSFGAPTLNWRVIFGTATPPFPSPPLRGPVLAVTWLAP